VNGGVVGTHAAPLRFVLASTFLSNIGVTLHAVAAGTSFCWSATAPPTDTCRRTAIPDSNAAADRRVKAEQCIMDDASVRDPTGISGVNISCP
jgi:hypothetical protein